MRRLPLTSALLAAIIALSVVTRTLWDPLLDRPVHTSLTYGLPAFENGAWWTALTGPSSPRAPSSTCRSCWAWRSSAGSPSGGSARRSMPWRCVACHLVGVFGAAGLLWLTRDHGYLWSTTLSHVRDAGPSAGFLGAAAAATVTVAPPWRGRMRTALVAYVVLFVIHLGALADLEHVLAVGLGAGARPAAAWDGPPPCTGAS